MYSHYLFILKKIGKNMFLQLKYKGVNWETMISFQTRTLRTKLVETIVDV